MKAYKTPTLQDSICQAIDLQDLVPKNSFPLKTNFPVRDKDKKPFQQEFSKKLWLDDDTKKDLRWKKLCFACQETWVLGHKCIGKAKAHYIEVYSDSEGEDYEQETTEELRAAEEESLQGDTPEGVIAMLSGIPRFHTLRVRGIVQGHRVGVLIDGGATHNFIDAAWVGEQPTISFRQRSLRDSL